MKFSINIFLPFFYHLPVKSLFFTNLPVNLKAGKSSTLILTLPGAFTGPLALQATFSARNNIQKLPNFTKSLNGIAKLNKCRGYAQI